MKKTIGSFRPLRLPTPQDFFFETEDKVTLRLRRYKGGSKGPVLIAPGFGMSTISFATDTVETNLPEYLYERNYDIWLFDYRSSPELAASHSEYTIDDILSQDWPAAVEHVKHVSGASDVQAVAHCVGSVTLLTSIAQGLQGVRSVVSSQFTPHVDFSDIVIFKTGIGFTKLLGLLGWKGMNGRVDENNWADRFNDLFLRFYPNPKRERCDRAQCHKIQFMYGQTFKHQNISDDTHQVIDQMFGEATLPALNHMTKIIHAHRMVNAAGEDIYLPNLGNLQTPVAFLAGEDNIFMKPSGSEKTYLALRELNGPDLYTRHVIPGYAHLDCFFGQHADRDVFPIVHAELERFN